jgi:HEAT repeat protein
MRRIALAVLVLILFAGANKPAPVTEAGVREALAATDPDALRAMGRGAIPHLLKLYAASTPDDRATIAWAFYVIGIESPEAKAALLKDIATKHERLRLQVQWALGRVSDDADVVETLAAIMRNDANPLFRDKAACALAYDQIHLTERQKVALYAKLIEGLADEKQQVRAISIQALSIHTGQRKGFDPNGELYARAKAIEAWKRWLEEYRRNL